MRPGGGSHHGLSGSRVVTAGSLARRRHRIQLMALHVWIRMNKRRTINVEFVMKSVAVVTVAAAVLGGSLFAQENKPVPKDSVRVFIPGCTKGYVLTAGRRTEDEPDTAGIPEGMHVRMNGPKKILEEIKA